MIYIFFFIVKNIMGTTILPGQVRNPRGNPNPNIKNIQRTGPTTDEGKFKGVIKRGGYRPWTKSRLIEKFRHCDKCPLREYVVHRVVNGRTVQVNVPAKCSNYKSGQKCFVPQGEFLAKMELYYSVGEEQNSLELQKVLTYSILEDAELAKEAEMVKDRRPGFYTHKFKELASKNLESLNKIKFGERLNSTNVNVNVDLSQAIIEACNKAKDEESEPEKVVDIE